MTKRLRILFQGSYSNEGMRGNDSTENVDLGKRIAEQVGGILIEANFDLILNGRSKLDESIGKFAVSACSEAGENPKDRIRTYAYSNWKDAKSGFGLVMSPIDKRWQDIRTFSVHEADAVVALIGGKGTSDVVQKAVLAKKPVFPIAIAGGGAQQEWQRLKQKNYFNKVEGDIDFLGDISITPEELASRIINSCLEFYKPNLVNHSNRVFIVHGRDDGLKNEVARLLSKIGLQPVILHEQADKGRTIFQKLNEELNDVGFGFILLTPDDFGSLKNDSPDYQDRARQNVVFEHGLLIGLLGPSRVCAIVKGNLEIPSDLSGVVYKYIKNDSGLRSIALDLALELQEAGYSIDANKLLEMSA